MRLQWLYARSLSIAICAYHLYDSYCKLVDVWDYEGDYIKYKVTIFNNWVAESGYPLIIPMDSLLITVELFAIVKAFTAILFILGFRRFWVGLTVCTLLQIAVVDNPLFVKSISEIDKQRTCRQTFTDLGLWASVMILAGSRKFKQLSFF